MNKQLVEKLIDENDEYFWHNVYQYLIKNHGDDVYFSQQENLKNGKNVYI